MFYFSAVAARNLRQVNDESSKVLLLSGHIQYSTRNYKLRAKGGKKKSHIFVKAVGLFVLDFKREEEWKHQTK